MSRKKIILIALPLIFALLLAFDLSRNGENQWSATAYVGFVRVYQAVGRPLLKDIVACRYNPVCSEYSIEAVTRHGIWRGLGLTIKRINACQDDVPFGTEDAVPLAVS
jgi:hypothetical protein